MKYDVVIVGNNWLWGRGGMTPGGVGDGLADYIDAGGKVVHYLVMEYVEGRSLRALLEEVGVRPEVSFGHSLGEFAAPSEFVG